MQKEEDASIKIQFESLQDLPDEEEATVIPKFSTIEYQFKTFIDKVTGNELTNNQIKQYIINHFKDYCDYDNFTNKDSQELFTKLWTNLKFLDNFNHVLPYLMTSMNLYYNMSICNFVYNYYNSLEVKDRDSAVVRSLLNIVYNININTILPLTNFMHKDSAIFIIMARYSSFEPNTQIFRMNNFIIKLGYNFTPNQLVQIYAKTYQNNFTNLLLYSSINISEAPFGNRGENSEEEIIYKNIELALGSILESMPTDEIRKVIVSIDRELHRMKMVFDKNNNPTKFFLKFILNNPDLYPRSVSILQSV